MKVASTWEATLIEISNSLSYIDIIFFMFTNLNKYRQLTFPGQAFYQSVGFLSPQEKKNLSQKS